MVSDGAARLIIAGVVAVVLAYALWHAREFFRGLVDQLNPRRLLSDVANYGKKAIEALPGIIEGAGSAIANVVPDVARATATAAYDVTKAVANETLNLARDLNRATGLDKVTKPVADAVYRGGIALARAADRDAMLLTGVGMVRRCPPGMQMQNGLCYRPCSPGWAPEGPMCRQRCPPGFRNDGLYCAKPAARTLPAGRIPTPWRQCPGGAPRYVAGLCYRHCPDGYRNIGPLVCSPRCPGGMTDIGVSCRRGAYGRGAGVIPDSITREEARLRDAAEGPAPVDITETAAERAAREAAERAAHEAEVRRDIDSQSDQLTANLGQVIIDDPVNGHRQHIDAHSDVLLDLLG